MIELRDFCRHPDDHCIDEVLFVRGEEPAASVEESYRRAILRIILRERYKTSGLSGDEWRFSTMLQVRRPEQEWEDLSSGYRDIEAHLKAIYPELYGDFVDKKPGTQWLYRERIGSICFL